MRREGSFDLSSETKRKGSERKEGYGGQGLGLFEVRVRVRVRPKPRAVTLLTLSQSG